jgi:hypothetical protein
VIDELLERLATFGEISHPSVSDLEEAVGPVFADIDDLAESTTEIHRPQAFAKGAFLFASIHGRHLRITANDPITIGTKKIVLGEDGLARLMPDQRAFAVGDAEKVEGKHVEIRSHRGWSDETGFTPLIRRMSLKTKYESSFQQPHRREDRELVYVNFVLVSEPQRVTAALGKNKPAAATRVAPGSTIVEPRTIFHPFYVSEIRADRTRLEWYAEAPPP